MANTIVSVILPPGRTGDKIKLYQAGTLGNTGGNTLTVVAGTTTLYVATVTQSLTGDWLAEVETSTGGVFAGGMVYGLQDDTGTYIVEEARTVGGGGDAPTAEENADAVRTELTVELARIDADISSRLAPTTAGRTLAIESDGMAHADVKEWRGSTPGNLDGNGFVPANFASLNGNSGRATYFADVADGDILDDKISSRASQSDLNSKIPYGLKMTHDGDNPGSGWPWAKDAEGNDIATATQAAAILAKWTTAMTESYAAVGVAMTPEQALFMLVQYFGDFAISGTTRTTKNLAGTAAMTHTLNDADNPTALTRAT